jgi:ferredoxin
MNILLVRLVCFSPTGTTRTIVQSIARGIGAPHTELIDITSPQARKHPLVATPDELLVLAVPVYMGRVPDLLSEWLRTIEGNGVPTACVVVYGNRVFDDALLELKNVLAERGCIPIAGAAFIGEHSFSSSDLPASQGRPDASDLRNAEEFGRRIEELVRAESHIENSRGLPLPGTVPYGGITQLWDVDFISIGDTCTHCGVCAEHCPVGAIDPLGSGAVDIVKCITCCACIKICPQGTRTKKPGPVMDASRRIHTLFRERKEPEFFF